MAEIQRVDQDPQCRQALAKADAIRGELAAIERELAAMRGDHAGDKALDAAALKVLAGEEVAARTMPNVEELHQKRRILKRALGLAEEAVTRERRRVVGDICKSLAPEAAKLGEQTCRAVLGLFDSMLSEKTFFDSLKARFGLLPSDIPAVWRPDPGWWRFLSGCPDGLPMHNPNNPTHALLKWYAEHRGVRAADIAARLQKAR